jgi:hypothetical protein
MVANGKLLILKAKGKKTEVKSSIAEDLADRVKDSERRLPSGSTASDRIPAMVRKQKDTTRTAAAQAKTATRPIIRNENFDNEYDDEYDHTPDVDDFKSSARQPADLGKRSDRVMQVIADICDQESDLSREDFADYLWSRLEQKYGEKFADNAMMRIKDYWQEYQTRQLDLVENKLRQALGNIIKETRTHR